MAGAGPDRRRSRRLPRSDLLFQVDDSRDVGAVDPIVGDARVGVALECGILQGVQRGLDAHPLLGSVERTGENEGCRAGDLVVEEDEVGLDVCRDVDRNDVDGGVSPALDLVELAPVEVLVRVEVAVGLDLVDDATCGESILLGRDGVGGESRFVTSSVGDGVQDGLRGHVGFDRDDVDGDDVSGLDDLLHRVAVRVLGAEVRELGAEVVGRRGEVGDRGLVCGIGLDVGWGEAAGGEGEEGDDCGETGGHLTLREGF